MIATNPSEASAPHSTAEAHGHAKRRKIAIACEKCREKKRRCDGARPQCASCAKQSFGQQCVYYHSSWRIERPGRAILDAYDSSVVPKAADLRRLETQQISTSATSDHLHTSQQADIPQRFGFQPPEADHGRLPVQNHYSARASDASEEAIGGAKQRPEKRMDNWLSDGAPDLNSNATTATPLDTLIRDPLTPVTSSNYGTTVDRTTVDAMGAVSNCETIEVTPRRESSASFFGPSSVVDFMSKVQRTINGSTFLSRAGSSAKQRCEMSDPCILQPRLRPPDHSHWETSGSSDAIHEAYDYVVPARSEADRFVESYFMNINVLHPMLHRPTFMQQYHKLWSPSGFSQVQHLLDCHELLQRDNEKRVVYVMFNLVMALGCRSDPSLSAADRISKSDRLFIRTQQNRISETLDQNTMLSVQILLLMGRYLQTTNKSAKCWNVVGLAIRIAQSLGLYIEVGESSQYSQLDIEMRRRVWCACLLFDRELSMTHGRPGMIHFVSPRAMILPSAIDDELLQIDRTSYQAQPEGKPSTMAFYIEMIRLSEVLSQILTRLYFNDGNQQVHPTCAELRGPGQTPVVFDPLILLHLCKGLHQLRDGLPLFLQPATRDGSGGSHRDSLLPHDPVRKSTLDLQSLALLTHQRHVEILLLRQSLLELFTREHGSLDSFKNKIPLEVAVHEAMLKEVSKACVSTAQEQINAVTDQASVLKDFTHAWWYRVYYLYTCGIVILIGRLCPSIEGVAGAEPLKASWTACLTGLSSFFEFSHAAQKAHTVLDMLDKSIVKPRNTCSISLDSASNMNMQGHLPETRGVQSRSTEKVSWYSHSMNPTFSAPASHHTHASPPGSAPLRNPRLTPLPDFGILVSSSATSGDNTDGPEDASRGRISMDDMVPSSEGDLSWGWHDLPLDWLDSLPFIDHEFAIA